MKFTLRLLSLSLLFVISSCSKDKDDDNGLGSAKIRVTVNGTTREFNTGATAIRADDGGSYSVNILGFAGGTQSDILTVTVGGDEPVTPGVYTEEGTGGSVEDHAAVIIFTEQGTGDQYWSSYDVQESAVVTITSISATSVQGTFRGKLTLDGNGDQTGAKTLTEGAFNVNFQ